MDVADLTLDELRLALAPGIADAAVFDGWSDAALEMAADQLGADRDVARLAFKDEGAMGMICAWIETIDRQMALDLPPEKLADMKIRERIRALVQYRLDAVAGQEESLRRALAIMATTLRRHSSKARHRGIRTRGRTKQWRIARSLSSVSRRVASTAAFAAAAWARSASALNEADLAATRAVSRGAACAACLLYTSPSPRD